MNDGAELPFDASVGNVTELRDRAQRLQRHNDDLVQFQYHVSHDLAAPISSTKGLLSLMAEDLAAGRLEELPDMVAEASEQMARLQRLIDALMSLSQGGAAPMRHDTIELTELLDDIIDGLSLHSRELEVSVSLDFDRPSVNGDPVRLRQIIANLISNARKFRDPDELAPWIEVSVRHLDERLCLRVADNGLGMSDEVAARAFGMFSRGSAEHPGHGLGLYIVAKHVERLGGSVRVASARAPTCIEVVLPGI